MLKGTHNVLIPIATLCLCFFRTTEALLRSSGQLFEASGPTTGVSGWACTENATEATVEFRVPGITFPIRVLGDRSFTTNTQFLGSKGRAECAMACPSDDQCVTGIEYTWEELELPLEYWGRLVEVTMFVYNPDYYVDSRRLLLVRPHDSETTSTTGAPVEESSTTVATATAITRTTQSLIDDSSGDDVQGAAATTQSGKLGAISTALSLTTAVTSAVMITAATTDPLPGDRESDPALLAAFYVLISVSTAVLVVNVTALTVWAVRSMRAKRSPPRSGDDASERGEQMSERPHGRINGDDRCIGTNSGNVDEGAGLAGEETTSVVFHYENLPPRVGGGAPALAWSPGSNYDSALARVRVATGDE